jgi:arginase
MRCFDNILLIPHKYGQSKDGVQDAHIYFNPVLDRSHNIVLLDEKPDLLSSLNNIYENCSKYNKKSLFIGGDHSISIATIKAIYKPGMKIIWIDAYAGLNTIDESINKNYNGMPLAFLTGLEKNIIDCSNDNIVPFENIAYIGLRSMNEYEKNIIKQHNIKVIDYNLNPTFINIELRNFIGDSEIHISFSVNALDPYFVLCTGDPIENGMHFQNLYLIFEYLLNFDINSMDIVELNYKICYEADNIFKSNYVIIELMKHFNIFKHNPNNPNNPNNPPYPQISNMIIE